MNPLLIYQLVSYPIAGIGLVLQARYLANALADRRAILQGSLADLKRELHGRKRTHSAQGWIYRRNMAEARIISSIALSIVHLVVIAATTALIFVPFPVVDPPAAWVAASSRPLTGLCVIATSITQMVLRQRALAAGALGD